MLFRFTHEKNTVLKEIYGLTDQHIDAIVQYELEKFKQERDAGLQSGRIYPLSVSYREHQEDEDLCWHGCDKVSHVYGFSGGGGS